MNKELMEKYPFMKDDVIWDIETYPNVATFAFYEIGIDEWFTFEISNRKDQMTELMDYLRYLLKTSKRSVGFNNIGFDYVVVHWILNKAIEAKSSKKPLRLSTTQIYKYAMKVIESKRGDGFGINVRTEDIILPQVDLFKINHFDNKAKMTSLKLLEFNMRSKNVTDLPYDVGSHLSSEEIDVLIDYNKKDVLETYNFYIHCLDAISFRADLTKKFGFDCTNLNDTKIGEKFFMQKIEEQNPDAFYEVGFGGKRKMKQTPRESIKIKECIFSYIRFKRPEFKALKKWLDAQVITETKGVFSNIEDYKLGELAKYSAMITKSKKIKCGQEYPTIDDYKELKAEHPNGKVISKELTATYALRDENGKYIKEEYFDEVSGKIKTRNKKAFKKSYFWQWQVAETINVVFNGFRLDIGTGGIHGSIQGQVHSDENWQIVDLDVASYYPNMAIANRVFPEHLNESFCDSYESFYHERGNYAKGTGENLAIKLGLNATYGNSNNKYSAFYVPKYTMSITIGGQLSLCMLIEKLSDDLGILMIQANTDGITFKCEKSKLDQMRDIVSRWEKVTGLTMEENQYSSMYLRDVNSYLSIYEGSGKLKNKGAYEYANLAWHKNMSALVVPMAAEHEILGLGSARDFILNHKNEYDFMLRAKVPRSSKLITIDKDGNEFKQQNICRYYPCVTGDKLVKLMPSDEVSDSDGDDLSTEDDVKSGWKRLGIDTDWNVRVCNNMDDFNWDIDYEYFFSESQKLIDAVQEVVYET